jgi:hypothetical protein
MAQEFFDGVDEHFKWTEDGWYTWDSVAAKKTALASRLKRKHELVQQGFQVKFYNLGAQLRRKGGIGTNYPDIEFLTGGFYLEYSK